MKPPLSTNPTWQAWFRDWFAKANPGATILKVNLYSADWFVPKNEATSIPDIAG
jgi:general stress protein 26